MKFMKKFACLTLVAVVAVTVAACDENKEPDLGYTYSSWTTQTPSNWNELTYQDANDTEILGYISGSFFNYNYEFDEEGKPIKDSFVVEYDAATKLEDVTETYAGNAAYNVPATATSGYAYKITLRDDIKWEDGEAITAEDFVYTMKEQLNPEFKNYRADSYYVGSTVICNAENYVKQNDGYSYSLMIQAGDDEEYIAAEDFVLAEDGHYTVERFNGKEVLDVVLNINDGGNMASKGLSYYASVGALDIVATDKDGNVIYEVEYEVDAEGNYVLDDKGNPVVKLDENGKPVYVYYVEYEKDADGKVKVDAEGNPIVKKDEAGNVVYKLDKDGNKIPVETYTVTPFYTVLEEAADEEGYIEMNATYAQALSECVALLYGYSSHAEWFAAEGNSANVAWQEMCYYGKMYTSMDFSAVGLFQGANEYELVIVLDKYLQLLDEDGNLTFKAAYNMASLPLVQESKYEQFKHDPVEGATLKTTTYNTSVESTSSWGPYKLTSFQANKQYVLEKNPNWYGWNMEKYEGQYQTDKIVVEKLENWNTAWLKFQKGEIDSISIDVTIADDYKNSEQAIFTPDDYVGSLQLQSSEKALAAYNAEGKNAGKTKMLLTYPEFRKALSLAINRADFAQQCTTSSKAGFGIFNSQHYYDVEHNGAYRNTDFARQVLCDTYGVDASKYNSLIAAEAAITGYDLEQARDLVDAAVDKAIDEEKYNGTDTVVIVFGTGSITESAQRQFDYIKNAWTELLKGTKIEGKLEMSIEDHGTKWATDFRSGAYDVCMGGWSGAAWDPGYFLLAYLDPNYMYSTAWDTKTHKMKFTLEGEGENGADIELELGLLDWYAILNGSHSTYNWAEGKVATEKRLKLIAALEGQILAQYYTVPLYYYFGASLVSYKWDYISRDYNTFMGYGGIRYATYNYNNHEWAQFVSSNNGQINYKD